MSGRRTGADGMRARRAPTRVGSWRLLDIFQATLHARGTLFGGSLRLPEFGAPDAPAANSDPPQELPESYLSDGEQQQAVQRERARRFVHARRPGAQA